MAIYPWVATFAKPLGIDFGEFTGVAAWAARVEKRPGVVSVAKLAGKQFKMSLAAQKSADPDSLDRMTGRGRYAVSLEAIQKPSA